MTLDLHEVRFEGGILRRGFWLYVWEVTPAQGESLYYVGRTGDSSSTRAQSPFNRMGQHLGSAENSNMLKRHLAERGIEPEECSFRLVALGPLEAESSSEGRREHDHRRDLVAAMERALAEVMTAAGCLVVNTVASRKALDAVRFADVRATFARAFPALDDQAAHSGEPQDMTAFDATRTEMGALSEITVRFAWTDVGAVRLERDGKLRFPVMGQMPGVYRFRITEGDHRTAYIGEAIDLRRRAQNYRTPGPTQHTSKRISALLRRVLTSGGTVDVSLTTQAEAYSGGNSWRLDLERKAARVLLEHAAIALTPEPVENL